MKHRAEIGAMVSLVAYTFIRFVAAGGALGAYGVDARWFLFWDVITVPPYVWSIGRLVRGIADPESTRLRVLFAWSVLGIFSFMAPYLYLYYAGAGEFPPLAWILLTLIVVLFAANALRTVRRKVVAVRGAPAPELS